MEPDLKTVNPHEKNVKCIGCGTRKTKSRYAMCRACQKELPPPNELTCNQCSETKSLKDYPKDKEAQWGIKKICKTCQNTKANNRLYARQAQGICSTCPEPAVDNKNYCQNCIDKMAERKKLKAEQDYKNGICQNCPNNRIEGSVCCEPCLVESREMCSSVSSKEARRTLRNARFKDGICRSCFGALDDATLTECSDCRSGKSKSRHDSYRATVGANKCVGCKVTLLESEHEFVTCSDCRVDANEIQRVRGRKNQAAGLCFKCTRPLAVNKKGEQQYYCDYHRMYYHTLSINTSRPADDGSKLEFETIQKIYNGAWSHRLEVYICGYTGFTSPHVYDFHMDHIDPLASGGSHKLGNIVLCESGFNASKSSKTVCIIDGVETPYRELLRATRFWEDRIAEGYSYDPDKRTDPTQIATTIVARLTDDDSQIGIHGKNQIG